MKGLVFIPLVLVFAVAGCVSSSNSFKSSSNQGINKDEGKYVVWQSFTGRQEQWKQMPNAFISKVDGFPVYGLNELPNSPYHVIGKITAGTMLGVEPMDKVELEAVQFAREHGADAILTIKNTPVQNGNQKPLFYHEWWAIGFIHTQPMASGIQK